MPVQCVSHGGSMDWRMVPSSWDHIWTPQKGTKVELWQLLARDCTYCIKNRFLSESTKLWSLTTCHPESKVCRFSFQPDSTSALFSDEFLLCGCRCVKLCNLLLRCLVRKTCRLQTIWRMLEQSLVMQFTVWLWSKQEQILQVSKSGENWRLTGDITCVCTVKYS